MLQADLKVLGGKFQGKLIPLNTRKFLVGREQDCHLRPNSDMVSRHHCIFLVDEYAVRLRDLGSTNGTRVNGELVRHEIVLNDGDKITIGKLELQLSQRKTAPVEPVPAGASAIPGTPEAPSSEFEMPAVGSGQETMYEIPALPNEDTAANLTSITGDTAIHTAAQAGLPAGYPAMPGYGYPPGYPAAYPMPYPGYPMNYPAYPPPGMAMPGYPAPMPGYPPAPAAPAAPATPQAQAVRLPPPEETGVRAAPAAPAPVAAAPEGQAAPPKKEADKSSNSAADIIKQYLQRRGGT